VDQNDGLFPANLDYTKKYKKRDRTGPSPASAPAPAEGDENVQDRLICLGSIQDLKLPAHTLGLSPLGMALFDEDSVERLCSMQYSLEASILWVNGRCLPPVDSRPREILFRPPVTSRERVPPLRIESWCRSRCFCASDIGPNGAKPKEIAVGAETVIKESDLTFVIATQTSVRDHTRRGHNADLVPAVKIKEQTRGTRHGAGSNVPRDYYMSVTAQNRINCINDLLPDLEIPFPYTIQDFDDVQKLCAIQLSGGHE
jgi:hypothetical protein